MLIFTGSWLRRKREALGFSQGLFARCVGTTEAVIAGMESGTLILDFSLIKRIYVGYRLIAYDELQDFYDFDGFVLEDEAFRNRKRTGYYGTGTIVYERWIQIDIATAIRIFELQQGILTEE